MLLDTLTQSVETSSAAGAANSIARFLTVLVLFVLVLAVTYLTTRFVAKNQQAKVRGSNIEVIETVTLAPNRFLQIVRIGKRYAALGIGKEEVSFLLELREEELEQARTPEGGGFAGILERMREKLPARETGAESVKEPEES